MELRKVNIQQALSNSDICRPLDGYEGIYTAVKYGMVYSHISNKFLRPGISKANGYLTLSLKKNKVGKTHYVHRIIATAFVSNPQQSPMVNHKNGNKLDNYYENLEWCTSKENCQHALATGLRKYKISQELIDKIISEHIRADKVFGAKALSIKYNIDKSFIHELLNKHKYN